MTTCSGSAMCASARSVAASSTSYPQARTRFQASMMATAKTEPGRPATGGRPSPPAIASPSMGKFSAALRTVVSALADAGKTTVVRVAFVDLAKPAPDPDRVRGYNYAWTLGGQPEPGDRVVVPGIDGPAYGVVVEVKNRTPRELASDERSWGATIKPVRRMVTADEMAKARSKAAADLDAWLDMARRAAGLPTRSRRRKVPEGYPDIPPADGQAGLVEADHYGSVWWKAYKNARSDDEKKSFGSVAHRWYAIRDRESKAQQPSASGS